MTDGRRARILVVDDDPLNRELLAASLQKGPYEVQEAGSGSEAIEAVRAGGVDLVLLDVRMPNVDGIEATRRIKALARDDFLPVILVTALVDSELRVRGLQVGADEFLTKPVDRAELLPRVRNLLALRADRKTLAERNAALAKLQRYRHQANTVMVHDLKNPLAAVALNMGFALTQLRNIDGTREVQEALEDARVACVRLQRLIAEMLDISRMEEGVQGNHRTKLNLAQIVRAAVPEFERRAGEQRITFTTRTTEREIMADPDPLNRAILALIENAFRFTPVEGLVDVSVIERPGEAEVAVSCTAPRIEKEARAAALEKFAPPSGSGTGPTAMGLYYARLVAEAHGGRIEIDEDARFPVVLRLLLPLPSAPP